MRSMNGGHVMKQWMMSIFMVALFIGVSVVKSDAVSVQSVIGSSVNCDVNNAGCVAQYFRNGIILCTGVTCPGVFSADPTSNQRFVGVGTGGCRESIDGGTTWTLCTTQPPGGAGTINGIGVTTNGTWIATRQTGGVGCTIGRSINRGTSWSTVNVLVAGCNQNSQIFTNVRCTSITCVIPVDDTNIGVYSSSDDGVTWGYAFTSVRATAFPRGFVFDGTNGFWIGVVAGNTIFTTTGNAGWTLGAVGLNPGGNCLYGINDSVLGPVMYCGGTTPRTFVNVSTSVVTNVTLSNGVASSVAQVLKVGSSIYIFGQSANPSCTGNVASLWVSINNATTFTELQCLSAVTFDGGDYALVGSNLYFTVANDKFIRFSY